MKVLILSSSIPPYIDNPGSIQRVVLFCKYLIHREYSVGLVGSTRTGPKDSKVIWWEDYLDKVKIFPLVPGKYLNYIDGLRKKIISKKKKNALCNYQEKHNTLKNKDKIEKCFFCLFKIFFNLIKKIFNNILLFGDDGIFEIPDLKKHLNRVMKTFKPDVIIVSVPYHSWLTIIPWLKRKYPTLPLIIDFRDGWTSTGIYRASFFIRKCWQDYIEKKLILSAKGIIFVSPGLKEFYCKKYKDNLPCYETVLNGYNEILWKNMELKKTTKNVLTEKHKQCIIKYIGSIGFNIKSFRSPYNIFLALESCLKKGIISSSDFLLSFTGNTGNTEILNDFPLLRPMIRINNPVSPLDSLKEMKTADFLLSIHKKKEGAEEVLTGKIFDYLRAGKPILAITTENCGIKKFLEKLDVGIWMDINDVEDISKKFVDILKIFKSNSWNEWRKKNTLSPLDIKEYSREYQYQKYEKFIDKIVNRNNE